LEVAMKEGQAEQFHCELALELERRRALAVLSELFQQLERDRPDAAAFLLDYANALAESGGGRPRGQQ
jgi:hypothetical protein